MTHEEALAEVRRLQAALLHIATGGISPSIGFAQRILLGQPLTEAHAAEGAFVIGERVPACRQCYDKRKVIDWQSRDVPRFYDCPACAADTPD